MDTGWIYIQKKSANFRKPDQLLIPCDLDKAARNCTVIQCHLSYVTYVYFFLPSAGWALLVAQMVKNLPAMQETWVQSLGQKNTLK